ncbi:MAG: hypothetical protein JSR31_00330, partial [Nitrospira sp.]|nr:hypothetical protein [Nitrospira sp.]
MKIEDIIRTLQKVEGDPQASLIETAKLACRGKDPSLFSTLEAAAVPHWFDDHILSALLGMDLDIARKKVGQLEQLPMVEQHPGHGGWNVHEATRLALRKKLFASELDRFRQLSARATAYFFSDDKPAYRVETMYHVLAGGGADAPHQLKQLWEAWNNAGRVEPLNALGLAIDELILSDLLSPMARARTLVCRGWIQKGRLRLSQAEDESREAVKLFHILEHDAGLADGHQLLGAILETRGSLREALVEYEAFKSIMRQLTQR